MYHMIFAYLQNARVLTTLVTQVLEYCQNVSEQFQCQNFDMEIIIISETFSEKISLTICQRAHTFLFFQAF